MKYEVTLVPGETEYVITENGEMFKRMFVHRPKNGFYPTVYMNGSNCLLHRVLATTFIPNPENKPFVNHINGIKNDYRLVNLEWTTSRENNAHAIATGLVDRGYCLKVYDVVSDTVTNYSSQNELARSLGTNPAQIHQHLRKSKGTIFKARYVIGNIDEDWSDIKERARNMKCLTRPNVRAFHEETKQYLLFSTVECVAIWFKTTRWIIAKAIKENSYIDGYKFEFFYPDAEDSCDKQEIMRMVPDKKFNPIISMRKPSRISVLDTSNGEVKEWDSCGEFADSIGVTKGALQKRMSTSNKKIGKQMFDKYQITYLK